jgi:hypothetical protein
MERLEIIENDLKDIKRILYGGVEEGEEDGLCKKVKDMHAEFLFFRRIYRVLMFFVASILLILLGILFKDILLKAFLGR